MDGEAAPEVRPDAADLDGNRMHFAASNGRHPPVLALAPRWDTAGLTETLVGGRGGSPGTGARYIGLGWKRTADVGLGEDRWERLYPAGLLDVAAWEGPIGGSGRHD